MYLKRGHQFQLWKTCSFVEKLTPSLSKGRLKSSGASNLTSGYQQEITHEAAWSLFYVT